jgi:xylan 1,4-beta-xylosidase
VTTEPTARTARADWAERVHRARGQAGPGAPALPPPATPTVRAGRGQVTVDWKPVPGACGYQVHRAERPDGPFVPVDHHGMDVLAVPHPPYCDTTGEPGREYWYAVSALRDVAAPGAPSAPARGTASAEGTAEVAVRVDAGSDEGTLPRPWRPMIGAEHLSHLLCADTTGGRPIGADLAAALTAARVSFGAVTVRAHGILCDDLGVYREVDGMPVHDFSGVDRVYDRVLELGLRPVVELSFMPRDLASDPTKTVFSYGAIVSPPKDWSRWGELVGDLVAHLVERYGLAEVRDNWSFEVWNEANLEVFWSGTPAEFWRLYDVTAAAVKRVHPGLRVGGPASAAAGWVEDMLTHLDTSGAPLDFLSTHTYGSPPLDLRPQLERHGRAGVPLWWTEWGVNPRHFDPVNDSVFSAAFLARGMRSAAGRIDALSYWVASDHFEELGRPPALLHGGFGLRTVGDLAKPRFWALELLDRLGDRQLRVREDGDGAGSLVESWAGAGEDGRVALALWNATLDQSKMGGHAPLDRTVTLTVENLASGEYLLRHHRVDEGHSNVADHWQRISGGADWPDERQWAELRAANRLARLHDDRVVHAVSGRVRLEFTLPMPSMSLVELIPR